MSPQNPSAVIWMCPACGRKTKANRRTGLAYAHNEPDSTALCSLSAAPVIQADLHDDPLLLGPAVGEQKSKDYRPLPLDDVPNVSVKAVRGGLPGSRSRH
jgi:hypothetical protein